MAIFLTSFGAILKNICAIIVLVLENSKKTQIVDRQRLTNDCWPPIPRFQQIGSRRYRRSVTSSDDSPSKSTSCDYQRSSTKDWWKNRTWLLSRLDWSTWLIFLLIETLIYQRQATSIDANYSGRNQLFWPECIQNDWRWDQRIKQAMQRR